MKSSGEWRHGACNMCLGAPMKARVKRGRIVEVKLDDVPGFEGKGCGKAIAGIGDRVYAPDRFLYPLKRVGQRGEGKLVRCTWDEVIIALTAKLKEYIDAGHPEYFDIWWGCPYQQDNIPFLYYWSAVIGSNISYLHGQVCFGDHMAEKMITFGPNHAASLLYGVADWARTKYAVIAGQNFPGTACSDGATCNLPFYSTVNKAKENGCYFVVLDPKLTDSAPWANEWIPVSPSKDTAFALGIANILIKEKLYDKDFLLRYTNAPQLIRNDNGQALKDKEGRYLVWDTIANSANPIPEAGKSEGSTLGIDTTFEVTVDGSTIECKTAFSRLAEEAGKSDPGISYSPEKIAIIARKLGNNKPSVVLYPGLTSGRYPNWFQTMRAYSVVNLLLGNFDKPGGLYFLKHRFALGSPILGSPWPEPPEVPEYGKGGKFVPAPWGNKQSVTNIDKAPCYTEPREFHPGTQALPWLHFDAIEEGKVRAVLSSTENAAITQIDSPWVEQCLKKLDLIIVGEQLPKEFVDLADYVIPEASYVERYHLFNFDMLGTDDKEHGVLYMKSAMIPPQGEAKPISWFLTEVGKRLGLGEYFEKLDLSYEWWDRMLKNAGVYPKVTAKKLVENGPYVEDYPMNYNVLFKPIATRSGRFEIYSNELAEECYHNPKSKWYRNPHVYPLPIHVPIAEPKNDDEFYLISGKAPWHQKSATQHNRYLMEDAIEGGCPYTAIYINADRAKRLGIKSGDLVEVKCVGPTKTEDSCVYNEATIGNRERARAEVTEGLQPKAAWIYFAGGHKSKSMLSKAREGITMNWLVPASVSPYVGGLGKNYSIVKIRKIEDRA